jgi:FkbM family methyltransferase
MNEVAVTDTNGKVLLEEMTTSTGAFGELVTASEDTELSKYWGEKTGVREVPAVRLDTCFDLYGKPDFVKIDTEGHEQKVVESGAEKLNLYHPKLVIEIHRGDYGRAIRERLPAYDWDLFFHPIYQRRNSSLLHNHYWMVSR